MIGGFPGVLAGLGAVNQGANQGAIQAAQALQQLQAAQQAQQWQQAAPIAYQSIGQLGQPPTGAQQATGQDVASAASGYQPGAAQSNPPGSPQQLPQVPQFGGFPQQSSFGTGSPPQYLDGVGPGMKSGQMPWSQFAPIMQRDESGGRNVPNYRFGPTRTASGVNQITDTTWNRYAPQAGAPQLSYPASPMDRPEAEQNRVGEAIYNKEGPAPWAKYNPVLARDLQIKTQRVAQIAGPRVAQGTQDVAHAALQTVDPATYGRQQLAQMMQAIDQAAPGAPGAVKFMALGMISKILQPSDQMALRLQMQQNQETFRLELLQLQQLAQGQRQTERETAQDERQQRQFAQQQTLETERETAAENRLDRRLAASSGEKLEASKQFDVVDDQGRVVKSGIMARERRDRAGWVDSDTGEPIKLPQGQKLRQITPSQTGGGRAQQQIQRQVTAGKEVYSNLDNAASLPLGTTTGPFGTYATGSTLFGAVQGDLVRTLTDQNSRFMQSSMASLERELSLLESPVYGGAYASKQIEALIPKGGDTVATTLFNLARIAQIADNALESIEPSPILSNEQKQYSGQLRQMLKQAIPWTPKQAMEFGARKGIPKQSFKDFVEGGGMGAQPPSGGAIPKVDEQGNEIKP